MRHGANQLIILRECIYDENNIYHQAVKRLKSFPGK